MKTRRVYETIILYYLSRLSCFVVVTSPVSLALSRSIWFDAIIAFLFCFCFFLLMVFPFVPRLNSNIFVCGGLLDALDVFFCCIFFS